MANGIGLNDLDLARTGFGLVAFFAPGFAWAWLLLRHHGWVWIVPAAVVLAFTLEPFAMLALNLLFDIPINLATGVYLSSGLALVALALGIRDLVERAVTT